jgi:acyl-CoA synthetase (AMP-forming)/AMP-acid ligase II
MLPDPKLPIVAGNHRAVTIAFDDHALRAPDRVAIVAATRSWTYGDVARTANQLAHWLTARGIGPGHRVAIHARRNAWTPLAMLGVLKSGAAFVLNDITVANMTPSLAQVLSHARNAVAPDLRLVFFAGELLAAAECADA